MRRVWLCSILAGISILSLPSAAQDYAREKRWAEEVVPGLVVGEALWLAGPRERKFLGLYAQSNSSKAAVLLVHGVGVHPDHGVIGALRTSLSDAGYTTMSIQMPVQHGDAGVKDYYPAVFPDAVERIRTAARWLIENGHQRIVLLSHSMGSWMSNIYFEETGDSPFAAWVCMGLTGGYGKLGNVKIPILDVYGENDLPNVLRADWRRRIAIESVGGSRQVRVAGADHHYAGKEKELAELIDRFIREQVTR